MRRSRWTERVRGRTHEGEEEVRMNRCGYVVLEIHRVYPFQPPEKGWHTTWQISPGW